MFEQLPIFQKAMAEYWMPLNFWAYLSIEVDFTAQYDHSNERCLVNPPLPSSCSLLSGLHLQLRDLHGQREQHEALWCPFRLQQPGQVCGPVPEEADIRRLYRLSIRGWQVPGRGRGLRVWGGRRIRGSSRLSGLRWDDKLTVHMKDLLEYQRSNAISMKVSSPYWLNPWHGARTVNIGRKRSQREFSSIGIQAGTVEW